MKERHAKSLALLLGAALFYLRHFVFTLIDPDHHTEDWTFVLESGQELRARFDLRRVAQSVAVPSGK